MRCTQQNTGMHFMRRNKTRKEDYTKLKLRHDRRTGRFASYSKNEANSKTMPHLRGKRLCEPYARTYSAHITFIGCSEGVQLYVIYVEVSSHAFIYDYMLMYLCAKLDKCW